MYHQNDLTMQLRDHRSALLREAEDRRLARQLRGARSSKTSRPGGQQSVSGLWHALTQWGRLNAPFGA